MASGVLSNRIKETSESAKEWIEPRLDRIIDPHELVHCEKVASRILRAIVDDEKIAVFSDYDVDGISSAALLSRTIRDLGGKNDTYIPDRLEEGYGLSLAALKRSFTEEVPDLLLVLDCGTRSDPEIEWISSRGAEVMVIDHHSRDDQPELPGDSFIINPHLPDQKQPLFQNHCTVGLVFKVVHALLRAWEEQLGGAREKIDLKSLLDFVALGTVADLVPLRGENRIFVYHGLKRLQKTNNHGLRALLQVADVDLSHPLSTSDIGFRLGPRINAGGRIDTGITALDLLLTKDNRLAFDLARKLDTINSQRRTLERKVTEEAIEMIGDDPPMGIVVWREDWHPGVVGIVAGRLARQFHRPAIVLGWDGSGYKGSGRGISKLNLLEILEKCTVKPPKWGGHPAAMGLSIGSDQIDDFARAFATSVEAVCEGSLPAKTLTLDAEVPANAVNRQTVLEIEALGPFGQENPEPIVAISSITLAEPARLMGRDHIRFDLPGAPGVQVIGWRMAENSPPVGKELDLALRLNRSWWRGRESIRGELVDWRFTE